MQVWQDTTSPKTATDRCGDRTGLAAADAAKAGVDLSSYGTSNDAFTFATTITDPHTSTTATITNGYQLSTAVAQYTMQSCFPKAVVANEITYNAFVCGADTAGNGSPGGRSQANLSSGGCVDKSGAPVSITNWGGVAFGSCTNVANSVPGFFTNTCSATYSGAPITCSNRYGVFADAALTTPALVSGSPAPFNYAGVPTLMTANVTLCSSLGAYPLLKSQCYAQYNESYIRGKVSACLPRIDVDWTATTAAQFARADFKPNSLVFEEKLTYVDANTAGMLTEQTEHRGVQVNDSSGHQQWLNCDVVDKGGLSFKRISDTKLLATYISVSKSISDGSACKTAYPGKTQKFFFYLLKP